MVLLQINVEALPPSEAFPYLGWTITYNNTNCLAVYQNLRKSRRRWGMITGLLANTGSTVPAQGMVYKEVAHSLLLYGSESWVMMGEMLKVLEGFHHRVARQIMGMT